ncbi:MAG: hypothetical protein A2V66_06325 [Ignavibacteria bacterium RBG_13_36_8]|nr:MAG: hypothetical protein A2V66_06325 [Ignavibacteria bacterium RBG_13_36_8]
MRANFFSVIILIMSLITACSTSQQTTDSKNEKDQEIYVFDDVGIVDTATIPNELYAEKPILDSLVSSETSIDTVQFIVQVGAFTTKERAENFVQENKSKLNWPINISYSDKVQLFVVQLPPFTTRQEAENVRNQLWQTTTFKDAFIVP